MILLFKEFGVDLEQRDHNLNNVFHYMSDMSQDKPEKALKAYCAMVEVIKDREVLREMIYTEGHNAEGMTPFEHMALMGSPLLLTKVSKTVGVIREPVLSISEANVLMQNENGEGNFITSPTIMETISDENLAEFGSPEQPRYNLDKFNVSMYESRDVFGKQSKVLNIMATRELTLLSEDQLNCLYRCAFLKRWWNFKVTQMHTFTSILQWIDIIYTVIILLLLVSVGGDTRVTPLTTTHIKVTTNVFLDHLTNLPSGLQGDPNDTLSQLAADILPGLSKAFQSVPDKRDLFQYADMPGMRVDELTPYFQGMHGYEWLNDSMVESMYRVVCNTTNSTDELYMDSCQIEAVTELSETCNYMDEEVVKNYINLLYGEYYEIFGFEVPLQIYTEATNIILLVIIVIAGLYLLFDLIERWIFLYQKVHILSSILVND